MSGEAEQAFADRMRKPLQEYTAALASAVRPAAGAMSVDEYAAKLDAIRAAVPR